MIRHIAVAIVAVLVATPAAGQDDIHRKDSGRTAGTRFEDLNTRIKANQTIYVMDPQGRETEGKLLRLSPSSMTLTVLGSEREFPRDEIVRVSKRGDALSNGIAIGAGIFAGWAIASIVATGGCDDVDLWLCAGTTATMAGIGAGVGALVDYSVKGRTVVYRRPNGSKAFISPLIAPAGAGLRIAVRF